MTKFKFIRHDGEVIEGEIVERYEGYFGYRVIIKTTDGRYRNIPEGSIREMIEVRASQTDS
jgi:hypothetical protein